MDEMKKSRYTEEQIVFASKQAELGSPVNEAFRKPAVLERLVNTLSDSRLILKSILIASSRWSFRPAAVSLLASRSAATLPLNCWRLREWFPSPVPSSCECR